MSSSFYHHFERQVPCLHEPAFVTSWQLAKLHAWLCTACLATPHVVFRCLRSSFHVFFALCPTYWCSTFHFRFFFFLHTISLSHSHLFLFTLPNQDNLPTCSHYYWCAENRISFSVPQYHILYYYCPWEMGFSCLHMRQGGMKVGIEFWGLYIPTKQWGGQVDFFIYFFIYLLVLVCIFHLTICMK